MFFFLGGGNMIFLFSSKILFLKVWKWLFSPQNNYVTTCPPTSVSFIHHSFWFYDTFIKPKSSSDLFSFKYSCPCVCFSPFICVLDCFFPCQSTIIIWFGFPNTNRTCCECPLLKFIIDFFWTILLFLEA